jgi:hypothetical protein
MRLLTCSTSLSGLEPTGVAHAVAVEEKIRLDVWYDAELAVGQHLNPAFPSGTR